MERPVIRIENDIKMKVISLRFRGSYIEFRKHSKSMYEKLLEYAVNKGFYQEGENIDLKTRTIHVRITKTDVDRIVCFTQSTRDLLHKFIVAHEIKGYLFFDFSTGERLTTSAVQNFVSRLKTRLKLPISVTPHKWRHTFASEFSKAGGTLRFLQQLMGHANLTTTERYIHLTRKDIISNYKSVMRDTDKS